MRRITIGTAILGLALALNLSMTAYAGGINSAEQSVIDYCSGTFQYNGKTYQATAGAKGSLYSKLAEDGVDLTPEQANSMKRQFSKNVAQGVADGTLVEVESSAVEEQPDEEQPKEEQPDVEQPGETNEPGKEEIGTGTEGDTTGNTDKGKDDTKENVSSGVYNQIEESRKPENNKYNNVYSTNGTDIATGESSDVEEMLNLEHYVFTMEEYREGNISAVNASGDVLFQGSLPIKNTGLSSRNLLIAGMLLGVVFIITIVKACSIREENDDV